MSAPEFSLTFQLSATSLVDVQKGLLRSVSVAEVGTATGHFAFLDAGNKVVAVGGANDAPQGISTKRVPLCADEQTIETIVAAGKMRGRVKAREDHDDSVGARAGYAEAFRSEGGKAVCDMCIFEAYRNRGVFLETANSTPELIGLSGDFKFNAEVRDGACYMRVTKVDAVDIVDQGALTHAGLFKANTLGVDMEIKETVQPLHIMAKASEAPDLKAFKAMCETVAAYKAANAAATAEIDEACASLATNAAEAPVAPVAPVKEEMKAAASMKEEVTKELTATFSTLITSEVTKAVSAAQVEFQKQMGALGIKATGSTTTTVAAASTTQTATAEAPKDFLSLKASIAKERNVKPSEAARIIMSEQPEVYKAHQIKLGILKG